MVVIFIMPCSGIGRDREWSVIHPLTYTVTIVQIPSTRHADRRASVHVSGNEAGDDRQDQSRWSVDSFFQPHGLPASPYLPTLLERERPGISPAHAAATLAATVGAVVLSYTLRWPTFGFAALYSFCFPFWALSFCPTSALARFERNFTMTACAVLSTVRP
jgi:hypothetical protein